MCSSGSALAITKVHVYTRARGGCQSQNGKRAPAATDPPTRATV
jgi:hypothetical protein